MLIVKWRNVEFNYRTSKIMHLLTVILRCNKRQKVYLTGLDIGLRLKRVYFVKRQRLTDCLREMVILNSFIQHLKSGMLTNKIALLQNAQGVVLTFLEAIQEEIVSFYKKLTWLLCLQFACY